MCYYEILNYEKYHSLSLFFNQIFIISKQKINLHETFLENAKTSFRNGWKHNYYQKMLTWIIFYFFYFSSVVWGTLPLKCMFAGWLDDMWPSLWPTIRNCVGSVENTPFLLYPLLPSLNPNNVDWRQPLSLTKPSQCSLHHFWRPWHSNCLSSCLSVTLPPYIIVPLWGW